jgi:NitT/TauT family transport system substrate-binding protein
MRRATTAVGATLLAVAALALVPGAIGAKKEESKITVCYQNAATDFTPLLVAAKEGFGAAENLEITPRLSIGTTPQLLQNNTCQIAIGSGPELMLLYANGVDVALVAGWQNRFGFKLLVRSDRGINKAADLKGKKLAVSTVGGPPDQSARALLKTLNLTDKDVDIVYIPAIAARLAAISNGTVDGAIFSPPVKQVTASGNVKDILDLSFLRWISQGIWTKRDFAVKNPQTVKSFLRALVVSNRWILQPQNKDKAVSYLSQMTGITDRDGLEEAYQYGIVDHLTREPVVDPVGLRNSIDYVKSQFGKTVNANDFTYFNLLDQVLTYRVTSNGKAGRANATLSGTLKQSGRFTWRLTTRGLTSPIASVTLQVGAKGKTQLTLCTKCKARASGVAKVRSGLSKSIKAGQVYVNVRTARKPGGELRLAVSAEPGGR